MILTLKHMQNYYMFRDNVVKTYKYEEYSPP